MDRMSLVSGVKCPPTLLQKVLQASEGGEDPSLHECLVLSDSLGIVVAKKELAALRSLNSPVLHLNVLTIQLEPPASSQQQVEFTLIAHPELSDQWIGYRLSLPASQGVARKQKMALKKVWEHSFEKVIETRFTERLCGGYEYRRDSLSKEGTVLRSVCLDGAVSMVIESSGEVLLLLLDSSNGAILMSKSLNGVGSLEIIDMKMDLNRLVVAYENVKLRRMELKIVEIYQEYRRIDRLESLKGSLKSLFRKQPRVSSSRQKEEASLQYFDETFVLDLSHVSKIALTQTLRRLTPQTLVLASERLQKVYQIPHRFFSARRPVLENSPAVDFPVEKLAKIDSSLTVPLYDSVMPLLPVAFLNDSRAIAEFHCEPSRNGRESATDIFVHGGYLETFRPASGYDTLPDSFSRWQTSVSLVALLAGILWVFRSLARGGQEPPK